MPNLRVHLVAIAKNEDLYIEDWMIHYFNLGIDKICIYDNMSKNPISELINNSIKLKQYFDLTNDGSKDASENDIKNKFNIETESQSNDNIKNQIEVPTESLINDVSKSQTEDNLKIETEAQIKNAFKDTIKNKIEIKLWTGFQNDAYRDYWKLHKNEFDWLLICDIDEFIDVQSIISFNASLENTSNDKALENTVKNDLDDNTSKNNIKDKLSNDSLKTSIKQMLEHYKKDKILSLRCIEYGDNEIIERDMSKSVYDVFTKKGYKIYNLFYKSFFNRHLIKNFNTQLGHGLIENRKKYCIDYKHKCCRLVFRDDNILENEPFIRHIRTYSLKEYLDQKYRIKYQIKTNNRRYLLSQYYFKINQWTEQKQKYIEEYRKKNNIIRILILCSKEQYNKYKFIRNNPCYIYGNPCHINRYVSFDFNFQGIKQLIEIVYDFDYFIFLSL